MVAIESSNKNIQFFFFNNNLQILKSWQRSIREDEKRNVKNKSRSRNKNTGKKKKKKKDLRSL